MSEFDNTENALLHLNNFKNKYLSKIEADYERKKKAVKITKSNLIIENNEIKFSQMIPIEKLFDRLKGKDTN
jgi:hypothetical protein